jgi:oxygen-dependent protoporphyrinogen oxidase
MVVNLYYTTSNALPVHGFGYLIPRSIPFEQNPEYALGVVFDSDASIGQDTAPGTKVTVMLGGHWWDGFDSYPDEEEAAAMAKSVLRRHLNIQEEPAYVHAGLQKECIPQYTVGHTARMVLAHSELKTSFNGQLAVAGNSYTGVGLNDCVRSARDVVKSIKNNPGFAGITGLESFLEESVYATTRTIGKEMVVTVMTKRS